MNFSFYYKPFITLIVKKSCHIKLCYRHRPIYKPPTTLSKKNNKQTIKHVNKQLYLVLVSSNSPVVGSSTVLSKAPFCKPIFKKSVLVS